MTEQKLLTSKENTRGEIKQIYLDQVILHKAFQIRSQDNMDLEPLAKSIEKQGLIHPPVVRPIGDKYELLAGYRRFHAMKSLGWKSSMFTIMELNDQDAMLLALTENVERKDVSPIEEAKSFFIATAEFGIKSMRLAETINKSEAFISNRLRLLGLENQVKEMIDRGEISAGHAEHALLKMRKYPKLQVGLAKSIVKRKFTVDDAEDEAGSMIHEEKDRLKFEDILSKTKFKKCPKCGQKANGIHDDYGGTPSRLHCPDYDYWNPETGKTPQEEQKEQETKKKWSEKHQETVIESVKLPFPRTNYFQIPYEKVLRLSKKKIQKKISELLNRAVPGKDHIVVRILVEDKEWEMVIAQDRVRIESNEIDSTLIKFTAKKDFIKAFIDGWKNPTKKDHDFMKELLGFPDQVNHAGKPIGAKKNEIVEKPTKPAEKTYKKQPKKKPQGKIIRCSFCHRRYPPEHMKEKHGWIWDDKKQAYCEKVNS